MFRYLKRAATIVAVGACCAVLNGCLIQAVIGTMGRNPGGGYDTGATAGATFGNCTEDSAGTFSCNWTLADGTIHTSTVSLPGVDNAFIVDPLILQVMDSATGISGTFDDGRGHIGALVVTAGLKTVPVDATTHMVAELGRQIVIVELPDGTPPGAYSYTFNVTEAQPIAKGMFAGKVQVGGKTYYVPLLPCTTNFASVPAFSFNPTQPVPLLTADYLSKVQGCDHKVYDFVGAPKAANYQGLWWNSPANSESGWGLNLAHQGDTVFASWFTYDVNGRDWWLVMTAQKTAPGTYGGKLYQTRGPAFNAPQFDPNTVVATEAGTGTLTFTDANSGTFAYTVGTTSQSKTITREQFGPLPTCTYGGQTDLTAATNYQDLWWALPAGSESGWGINVNHEGDTIFATWFTYDLDGNPLWLVVTAQKTGPGVYSGDLYQTVGTRFDAFNPDNVVATKVGTATLRFVNGNDANFTYTVQLAGMATPFTKTKVIARELFSATGTVCQ